MKKFTYLLFTVVFHINWKIFFPLVQYYYYYCRLTRHIYLRLTWRSHISETHTYSSEIMSSHFWNFYKYYSFVKLIYLQSIINVLPILQHKGNNLEQYERYVCTQHLRVNMYNYIILAIGKLNEGMNRKNCTQLNKWQWFCLYKSRNVIFIILFF